MVLNLIKYYISLLFWAIAPVSLVKRMQLRKFRSVYKYALKHSKFYKDFYESHGVANLKIKSFDDIQKIPILDKHILRQQNLEDILTLPLNEKIDIHTTSGSSGEPTKLAYTKFENFTAHMRVFFILRRVAKYKPWHKITMITRYDENEKLNVENELSFIKRMQKALKIFEREIISIYRGPDHMIERLAKNRPQILWSTPSVLEILLNRLIERGIKLNIPYLFFTSEGLSSVQFQKFKKYLSSNIIDIYGAQESPTLGYEINKSGKRSVFPNSNLFEFNNAREIDGNLIGDVLISNLINKAMPIIRYDLKDFGIIKANTKFPHKEIGEIVGRIDDILTLPDGNSFVHHHAHEMFMDFEECEQFKFEQRNNGAIHLLLKANRKYSEEEIKLKAINRWNRRFEKYPLEIEFVEKFQINPITGKFKNMERVG